MKLSKQVTEHLEYVRGHPHSMINFLGNDKMTVEFRRFEFQPDSDTNEHAFSIDISDLTYEQAKKIMTKLGRLKVEDPMKF